MFWEVFFIVPERVTRTFSSGKMSLMNRRIKKANLSLRKFIGTYQNVKNERSSNDYYFFPSMFILCIESFSLNKLMALQIYLFR